MLIQAKENPNLNSMKDNSDQVNPTNLVEAVKSIEVEGIGRTGDSSEGNKVQLEVQSRIDELMRVVEERQEIIRKEEETHLMAKQEMGIIGRHKEMVHHLEYLPNRRGTPKTPEDWMISQSSDAKRSEKSGTGNQGRETTNKNLEPE